jgi:hypothetical protein
MRAVAVHMTSYTLNMRREVQRDTLLCWAAVSVMAIRSFPERRGFRHATQEEVVAYERAGEDTLVPRRQESDEVRRGRVAFREGFAKATANPWLLGLDRTRVDDIDGDNPRMLSRQHFLREIGQRRRPILIRWMYGKPDQPAGKRSGAHELIVTGYNSKTHEIRIWDPWPAANMRNGTPARRERWIPFSRYENPVSDQGVEVRAEHEHDEFALRLKGSPIDLDSYPKLAKVRARPAGREAGRDVAPGAGGFDLSKPIRKHMKTHVVRRGNGQRVRGPFKVGTPIPVVPLTVKQLFRRKRRPASLLGNGCRTVVVPILKNRRVVDSFLLTRGARGWRDGGYSNNEIASRVTQWRRQNARHPACKDKAFFLLSIPEHGTFFLANGYGEQANLISLQNGKARLEPADKALKSVIRKIATSARNRKRKPTRPGYRPK